MIQGAGWGQAGAWLGCFYFDNPLGAKKGILDLLSVGKALQGVS